MPPLKQEDGTHLEAHKGDPGKSGLVISKEIAGKIELLQNPSEKNKTVRHALLPERLGNMVVGRKIPKMKLNHRWLKVRWV